MTVAAFDIARAAYERHHASQREPELRAVVDLVAALKPKVIVEIGCDGGGTLYCWRQLCDAVYGITLPDNSWATGGQGYDLVDHGATVLRADSRHFASIDWLEQQLAGREVDVLHIDGDHSYAGARADFDNYSPFVRVGGIVLIHDVANMRDPRVDVPRYWAELQAEWPTQTIAQSNNPVGFGVLTIDRKVHHA